MQLHRNHPSVWVAVKQTAEMKYRVAFVSIFVAVGLSGCVSRSYLPIESVSLTQCVKHYTNLDKKVRTAGYVDKGVSRFDR